MSSLDSVHRLLSVAFQLLDQAASEIRDAGLEPATRDVEHIGRALAEISEILHRLYAERPDLKPSYLNELSSHPEANKRLTQFMFEASELERAGQIGAATEKYRQYLAVETSDHHRKIAESEIRRLSDARQA